MTEATAPELNNDSIVSATPRQISTGMGGEAAILHLDSGKYFGLNPVGARIWELLAQPCAVGVLLQVLQAEYEVPPERCRADLLALLRKLHAAGLIEIRQR